MSADNILLSTIGMFLFRILVVYCKPLMEILRNIGVDWKDRCLIIAPYMRQNAVVRVNGENTEPCIIGRGVRIVGEERMLIKTCKERQM